MWHIAMDKKLYTTDQHHIVMNREPRHMADTVSYMLQWELCEILDWNEEHQAKKEALNKNFAHIKMLHDGYTWYVLQWHLSEVDAEISKPMLRPIFPMTKEWILQAAREYMWAPYLRWWRTEYGIDCSGLTQQIYKKLGIQLLRDASQQATQWDLVAFEQHDAGDIVFFEEVIGSGKIKHVWIVTEPWKIMHASEQWTANVRINTLTIDWIMNDNGAISNHYVMTKRFRNIT